MTTNVPTHLVVPRRFAAAICVVVCCVGGCGAPPEANAYLTTARAAYTTAVNDGEISVLAPAALADAREALEHAERAWRDKRDVDAVEHHAYVVQLRIRLAEERAALRAVEREIRKARMDRQRALLALRTAKAKAAIHGVDREVEEPAEAAPPAPEPVPVETGPSGAVLGAVLTRRGLVLTLHDEAFADDRIALRPDATPTLEALVDFLDEYAERRVRIEGFADASGGRAEALAFSQRRAEAVRSALVERGVAPERVSAVGLGSVYPVADNRDPEARRQNRRVEIVISDPQGAIPPRD